MYVELQFLYYRMWNSVAVVSSLQACSTYPNTQRSTPTAPCIAIQNVKGTCNRKLMDYSFRVFFVLTFCKYGEKVWCLISDYKAVLIKISRCVCMTITGRLRFRFLEKNINIIYYILLLQVTCVPFVSYINIKYKLMYQRVYYIFIKLHKIFSFYLILGT